MTKNFSIQKLTLLFVLLTQMAASAAPPAPLVDLDGKLLNLQPKTSHVLVYFWATWCTSCKEKLQHTLPEWEAAKKITVVNVNTDRETDRVRHYLAKNGIGGLICRDETKDLQKALRVLAMPSWAVYRIEKNDRWVLVDSAGGFDEDRVNKALSQ